MFAMIHIKHFLMLNFLLHYSIAVYYEKSDLKLPASSNWCFGMYWLY